MTNDEFWISLRSANLKEKIERIFLGFRLSELYMYVIDELISCQINVNRNLQGLATETTLVRFRI